MDLAARVMEPGQRLEHVGVLVACEPGEGPLRGLAVRVHGEAVARGVVAVRRARARPWSARLAPWEQAGWEHALEPRGEGAWACELRAARVRASGGAEVEEHAEAEGEAGGEFAEGEGMRGGGRRRGARVREALAHAVWVSLEGCAGVAGEGELVVEVAPAGEKGAASPVRQRFCVCVREERPREVLTLYLAWEGPLVERAGVVREVLDRFARSVAALPAGPRVLWAHGVANDRVRLRRGCVVLGERGLVGDARWGALARRLSCGALEQLALATPGTVARAGDVLEVALAHPARWAPGPVELALSVGRERAGARFEALAGELGAVLEGAGVLHGFVAEHGWTPGFLERTPWERGEGSEPARTVEALQERGRVTAEEARSFCGPRKGRGFQRID